ncbi:MAG: NAD-glutamate dehydrogenase [Dongiaceae bacterium]
MHSPKPTAKNSSSMAAASNKKIHPAAVPRGSKAAPPQLTAIADSAAVLAKKIPSLQKLDQEMIRRFAEGFYANVPLEDLNHRQPDYLAAAVLDFLDFVQAREPAHTAIKILPPDESRPWQEGHSYIYVLNTDMPFLVDTATMTLNRHHILLEAMAHPMALVKRDQGGRLQSLDAVGDRPDQPQHRENGFVRESYMMMRLKTAIDQEMAKTLAADMQGAMDDVASAVADFTAMRQKLAEVIQSTGQNATGYNDESIFEAQNFLRWLDQDHFVFLGYRAYVYAEDEKPKHVANSGLGILRSSQRRVFGNLRDLTAASPEIQAFLEEGTLIAIRKSHSRSLVHRPAYMDVISIKIFDAAGKAAGEHRFIGLFTSQAYNRGVRDIPWVRQKLERVLEKADFVRNSHNAKALVDIVNNYPRDELLQMEDGELYRLALGILLLKERQRTALFVRPDKFNRYISALVFTPRDSFSTTLREKFAQILEKRFHGKVANHTMQVGETPLARLHYMIELEAGQVPSYDVKVIEAELAQAARGWGDALANAGQGLIDGAVLNRYANAFPAAYQNIYTTSDAIGDIQKIESLAADAGALAVQLYTAENFYGVRLYQRDKQIPLSDILPMLENLGLRVIDEFSFAISPPGGEVWLHDFTFERSDGGAIDVPLVKERFENALLAVWHEESEDDGFNRLVMLAGLTAREAAICRAYSKYLQQTGFSIRESAIEYILAKHAPITRLLVDLFLTSFDPAQKPDDAKTMRLCKEIEEKLSSISNADEDRTLRRYLNLIKATLRSNYFQVGADGKPKSYLSFKFDSRKVEALPEPKPFVEIFVYAPTVEAIHLRGGKVARGGIRWSDRRDDFRTEVLGLLKAQTVKNTVIVPVGSKGGFVVKNLPPHGDRAETDKAVKAAYRIMMCGLLDITDNIIDGKITPPANVVRKDDADPYLVVAADKGTAKFSDIANGIAGEYNFWLGDAFASGGSAGYDHKGMAITAKGAWEAVHRHFREMGLDYRTQAFTCVGVGDMSGDVFGNGMLLDKNLRLIAAFDHRHIFIDPNPDLKTAYAERERLFNLPVSSWADYAEDKISKGGGVYSRQAKIIKLSKEAQAALDTGKEELTPPELMQEILKAPVDLLWLGGIGTYIKSAAENNAEVGDRANDLARVNADNLRCKVVGEGANLGFTQRARIDYAALGGRINTDAIDNSAGVDTSDHEVNIKILLQPLMQDGKLPKPARDELLRAMTGEVASLVLRDNYLQTLALSVAQSINADYLEDYGALMRHLEKQLKLNRVLEFLPKDGELAERARQGRGLTRPELAVIMAYAKMGLKDDLQKSTVPDEGYLFKDLLAYFPAPLQQKYAGDIAKHQLRREIIVTSLTNDLINRVGSTFCLTLAQRTGANFATIARAYAITRAIFGLPATYAAIEALDHQVDSATQTKSLRALSKMVERATQWFATHLLRDSSIEQAVAHYAPGIAEIRKNMLALIPENDKALFERKIGEYKKKGVPAELAATIVLARLSGGLPPIIDAAIEAKQPPTDAARLYFAIGERFGLDWMRRQANQRPAGVWEERALSSLTEDLLSIQTELTKMLLKEEGKDGLLDRLNRWCKTNQSTVSAIDALIQELQTMAHLTPAQLTVASRQVRRLLD